MGPLGELISYKYRGSSVSVYSVPGENVSAEMRLQISTRFQTATRLFFIPRQPAAPAALIFPPTSSNGILMIDDTITDEFSNLYIVNGWANKDGLQAIYAIAATQSTFKQIGQVGQ